MREFLVYSGAGVTGPGFNLKDLPGSGGRMDLLARCVISALWLSHDIRRDARIYLNLNGPPNPPLTVRFDGESLKNVSPDERNIAIWIKKALKRADDPDRNRWFEVHPGIFLGDLGFEELIDQLSGELYLLDESGEDISSVEIGERSTFIVGDNYGLPEEIEETSRSESKVALSLGPESYLSSQSITATNIFLDRPG